jgi:hypothetical protein
MAQRGVPGGWDSPADRPSILAITVESAPRRRAAVRPAHVLIGLALLGAIAAAVAIAALPGGGGVGGSAHPPAVTNPLTPGPQQPSVVVQMISLPGAAPGLYRIPLGCLRPGSIAQTVACSAHAGYAVALLRRIGGSWRGTLMPTDASCVPAPVPPLARGKVRACPR